MVKHDCPTCTLVAPVLAELADRLAGSGRALTVYTQDDPAFPAEVAPVDDTDLDVSYRLAIETVPTLLRSRPGPSPGRIVGWSRDEWRAFTGCDDLGVGAARVPAGLRLADPRPRSGRRAGGALPGLAVCAAAG